MVRISSKNFPLEEPKEKQLHNSRKEARFICHEKKTFEVCKKTAEGTFYLD